MPRKRTSLAQRETPEAIAARRARIEELRTPLRELTPKEEAKVARDAKEWVDALPADDNEAIELIRARAAKRAKKAAKRKPAELDFVAPPLKDPAPAAQRPAPATEAAPVDNEPHEPPKARRRLRAGLVAVIDPRLYDTDEEDWT